VLTWARGLGGVPDVPHTATVSSILTEEGSGVGKYKAPPSIGELNKLSCHNAIRLTLNIALIEQHVKWDAILWRETLFIHIPNAIAPDNSKEAFISLLEFAEEELTFKQVTVYFSKDRPDRNILVRLFNFIGFAVLSPNHPLAPSNASEDLLYMAYGING